MRWTTLGSLILLLAVGGACQPQPRAEAKTYAVKLEALRGRHIDDVRRGWGPEASNVGLADGNALVTFKHLMPAFLAPQMCTTTFEVDPDGRILKFHFTGPGCRMRPADDLGLGLK